MRQWWGVPVRERARYCTCWGGNLDSRTEIEVVSLLKHCVTEYGQTLVMITHDETIAQMADRMIVIEDGKVVRS